MCQRERPDEGEIASSPRVGVAGLQGTPNSLRDVGEGRQARPGSEVQMDVGRILPCPFCVRPPYCPNCGARVVRGDE